MGSSNQAIRPQSEPPVTKNVQLGDKKMFLNQATVRFVDRDNILEIYAKC